MASDNEGRKFPKLAVSARAGGEPQTPDENPDGFSVSGTPRHLNDKGSSNPGRDVDRMTGTPEVDGTPGAAPSSDEALRAYGGLHNPKFSSTTVGASAGKDGRGSDVSLPQVPITADPANEGG